MGRGSKVEESLYPMVVGIKSSENGIVVEAYGKPNYEQLKRMRPMVTHCMLLQNLHPLPMSQNIKNMVLMS